MLRYYNKILSVKTQTLYKFVLFIIIRFFTIALKILIYLIVLAMKIK